VKKLKEEFSINPEDLICAIGPCIQKCCFEVDEDVKNLFYEKFEKIGQIEDIIKKSENKNKYYIDTTLLNRLILNREGLRDENVIDSMICTKCNHEKLHSFRESKSRGRNTSIIMLKK